jgi:hypothetical protein
MGLSSIWVDLYQNSNWNRPDLKKMDKYSYFDVSIWTQIAGNKRHEWSVFKLSIMNWSYEDRLKSSWTHLINLSWNFVEVRWRSLFRRTSLGKRCSSYNAPPTSRKRKWSNKTNPRTFQTVLVVDPPSKKKGSFKTTVTQTLTTVRGMKITTPLLHYPNYWHKSPPPSA